MFFLRQVGKKRTSDGLRPHEVNPETLPVLPPMRLGVKQLCWETSTLGVEPFHETTLQQLSKATSIEQCRICDSKNIRIL